MQKFVIIAFFISCIGITLVADNLNYLNQALGTLDSGQKVGKVSQEFLGATFFSVDKKNQSMEVNSSKVVIQNSDGRVLLAKPFGQISSSGELLHYEGETGEVFPSREEIRLFGDVKLKKTDLFMTGQKMTIYQKRQRAELLDDVNTKTKTNEGDLIRLQSESASFDGNKGMVSYSGKVKGNINFSDKEFSPPLFFQSKVLDYFLRAGRMDLSENVKIRREDVKIKSQRGSVFLNRKNKKVNYFELNDDVRFSETFVASNGEKILRTGLSQKLEGFGFERKLVFSGFPKIKQLDDLIQGNTIVIREADELVEIINTNSKFKFKE